MAFGSGVSRQLPPPCRAKSLFVALSLVPIAQFHEVGQAAQPAAQNAPRGLNRPENAEEPSSQPSRILPATSGFRALEGTTFSFGGYREWTRNRTAALYEESSLGVSFAFEQQIRSFWKGGLLVRWSDWKPRDKGDVPGVEVSPLSIFSRVEAAPRLPVEWGVPELLSTVVRPSLGAGVGYVLFTAGRALPSDRRREVPGEAAVTYGLGLRLVWPGRLAVKWSVDRWRGVRTFRYAAILTQMEFQFGDVNTP